MTIATVVPSHITLDQNGVARIDATRWKVIHIAEASRAYGWTPQEMHAQWPDLTLAQIHAAMAYYYDHQSEMDAEMDRALAERERLRHQAPESSGRKKLRAAGRLP